MGRHRSVRLENLALISQDLDFHMSLLLPNLGFISTILKQNMSQRWLHDGESMMKKVSVKVSGQIDVGRLLQVLRDGLSKCVSSKNVDK